MSCPSCQKRKGRRDCPALGQRICAVCCGTKRLVEIRCPDDCPHLATARSHPPAVVRRQQERDTAVLVPSIRHLNERQQQLFFLFQAVIAGHTPDGFVRLVDGDLEQAAAATAATLETAARGIVYEHLPASAPARRLARDLTDRLEEARTRGVTIYDGEAAIALRAIEQGVRDVRKAGGGDQGYLDLMGRLLQTAPPESRAV
jgi:hypothetical protein